jgi:hypothetical protein
VIDFSPVEYMQWLTGIYGMAENDAKNRVEKLYLRQTGMKITLYLRPYKNEMVWDYEYAE